jgi:hypothetical protein
VSITDDPENPGRKLGWLVVRDRNPTVVGQFATHREAEVAADQCADECRILYGSHLPGTDDWVSEEETDD